jgi:hypothetical protein
MFFVVWCYPANCHDSEYSAVTGSHYGDVVIARSVDSGAGMLLDCGVTLICARRMCPCIPSCRDGFWMFFHSGILTRWPPGGGSAQCYPPFLLGASSSDISGANPGTGPEPQWFPDMKSWKSGPARSVLPSDIPTRSVPVRKGK